MTHLEIPPMLDESARTQVMVLASEHLAGLGEAFRPTMLDRLIKRLMRFEPDLIALEHLPPRVTLDLDRHPALSTLLRPFIGDRLERARQAQRTLGLDFEAASRQAEAALDQRTASGSHLVLLLLAALDDVTTVLHWSYLDEAKRKSGEVPPELALWLDTCLASASEHFSIDVRLARELDHNRLGSFDDHHDADLPSAAFEQEAEDRQLWEYFQNHPFLARESERMQHAVASGDLLEHYEWLNTPEFAREITDFEWNGYLRLDWPSGLNRIKVVQWEVRNLLMAAHLRRLTADYPGGRVLAIVGANHKRLLDLYLSHMLDGRVVQLSDV